jgi:hypothetical protein
MSKHSPGPWVIQDNAAHGVHIYSAGGCFGGGSHICRVSFGAVRVDAEPGASERQMRANALLMASAPELLEALKQIANQEWVENCLDPQWAARIARAAIAKAEGGA